VKCGPKESIASIPVDEIHARVEASSSSLTDVNPHTRTSITAAIEAIGDTPALGCGIAVDKLSQAYPLGASA